MKSSMVIATALLGILINMSINTGLNLKQAGLGKTIQTEPTEQVVQVIGRYHVTNDGYSNTPGFIVINDGKIEIAKFDKGSMAEVGNWTPRYMIKYGTDFYYPITVETEAAVPSTR